MPSDTIFLINSEGGLEKAPHTQYASEDLLQQLVQDHPDILAGEQIDPDDPPRWLLIQREAGIPDREGGSDRWSIDHLLLDQRGRPTFVEVKRSSDTRIRREVVGQMLDYAANAKKYWPEDKIRAMAAENLGGLDALEERLRDFLVASNTDEEVDTEAYWKLVEDHLRGGKVRLLFVADSIPTELRRIIEFLNEHMPLVEVLGVEIRQYEGKNIRALVPRVVGQTEFARQQKPSTRTSAKTTREAFLAACPEKTRAFFIDCFDLASREGYSVVWGTKGFSLRVETESDGSMSLFYGYPGPGDGQGSPVFQAYLGYLKSDSASEALRKALSTRLSFLAKGKHTLELEVTQQNSSALRTALPDLLALAKEHVLREQS